MQANTIFVVDTKKTLLMRDHNIVGEIDVMI